MIGDSRVDFNNANTGSVSPGIRFGSGDTGEGISSDRSGTTNKNGIDLYTAFNPRLSVSNAGFVGIGTTTPGFALDVRGTGNFLSSASSGMAASTSAVGCSGVNGNNTATSGAAYGVTGATTSPAGIGIYGVNLSGGGYGVYGEAKGTASNSTGVYGAATNSSGDEPTYGVYGTSSTASLGFGFSGGAGVAGTGPTISSTGATSGGNAGVWGDLAGPSNGLLFAVKGTADDNIAIVALNSTPDDDTLTPALNATNGATNLGALVFETGGGLFDTCTIDVGGDLACSGTISQNAATDEGRHVKLYGVASPENWFEDFGSGQLSDGSAQIALEPAFASTVNTGEAYHVFLTPNGDSKGLYVAGKTAAGFEVREQGGGTSNISFDYRLVAKRRGYESVRLEDMTEQTAKLRQRQAEMQASRAGRKLSVPARAAQALTLKATPVPSK